MTKRHLLPLVVLLTAAIAVGCTPGDDPLDPANASFPSGKADGGLDPNSAEARAVIDLVNDPNVTVQELDIAAGLNRLAAENIVAYRDSPDGPYDGIAGSKHFPSALAELDSVKFVGPYALAQLVAYAIKTGRLPAVDPGADVIFSPQPADHSHTARIAALIADARHSIDIAMYSFSDAGISDALAKATARGVKVRFLFYTTADDVKLAGAARASSKSGALEREGVDVRYVNKILHHKFIIIDGPRDDVSRADTAIVATGSANWSYGGAQIFDENTAFIAGNAEVTLRMQREFNYLWKHSRDFSLETQKPFELSTLAITDDLVAAHDDPDVDVYFTSKNFTIGSDPTTFRLEDRPDKMAVADEWVKAIEGAKKSIWIASGHLRLRPVAEALMAKKRADPNIDIRVYLDQQEYINAADEAAQESDQADCLAGANTADEVFDCKNRGFLYSKEVGDAGVALRYKVYAYRWDFSYAKQMHDKYMIIDGDELMTGSYNLSINSEQSSFENDLQLRAPEYSGLISAYQDNFRKLWGTGRSAFDPLEHKITTASSVPLVFPPMALTWQEDTDLRALIRENCPQVDTAAFETQPADHQVCQRP